jgi:hypothetical protein
MFRFIARHGIVRMVGGRAVPVLMVWDLVILADRTRRIPVVDRGLRRGVGVAQRGLGAALVRRPWSVRVGVPGRGRDDVGG